MRISDWSSDWCSSDLGVDFHDRITAIVSIDCAASFARTTEIKGLPIGGSTPAFAKPDRQRLGMNCIGHTRQRRSVGGLTHVPCLHTRSEARSFGKKRVSLCSTGGSLNT